MSEFELLIKSFVGMRGQFVVRRHANAQKHSSRVARVTVPLPFETVHTAPHLLCVYLALVALPPFEHACAVVLEPRVKEAEHLRSSKKRTSCLLSCD